MRRGKKPFLHDQKTLQAHCQRPRPRRPPFRKKILKRGKKNLLAKEEGSETHEVGATQRKGGSLLREQILGDGETDTHLWEAAIKKKKETKRLLKKNLPIPTKGRTISTKSRKSDP